MYMNKIYSNGSKVKIGSSTKHRMNIKKKKKKKLPNFNFAQTLILIPVIMMALISISKQSTECKE